ncbi:GNAT family N-acetyltransferase [Nocardia sp. alder85J]|uniref:GNAT family N-acetyltransferase n=1 Tax=Nocardia sp. alder85J TaxID=2862949 RepID=UPI001CD4C900|nr:GNAT family N-acetyltransferase [Nocardia sp. alder85J]MCX4098478.1 GNAT family N-acetyltransferase [Nocardia sp. alder85J]
MICYAWRDRLDGEDRAAAEQLVTEAAAYDADAGFAVLDTRDVRAVAAAGTRVWHLPIKARKDLRGGADAPMVLVAYLRLTVDEDGQGTVGYTVHPGYRSRGVTTQLVEELGLEVSVPGGWQGTGATALRCWAFGSHPAAQRLTRRFGIAAVARLWTLLRHLTGPFAMPLDDDPLPAGYELSEPLDLADPGVAARIEALAGQAALTSAQADRFAEDVADRHGSALIATHDGKDAGFAWFDPAVLPHAEWSAGWVRALMVDPAARGAGLGAALLTRALHAVAAGGAQVALLRVDPDNRAAVRMCRLRSFEQDEAHACYQLGEWDDPPVFARP